MSVNYRLIHTSPERVFEVLANGWLYPSWVVGASRMRDVDDSWPTEGAQLFHSFGVWPFLINDSTSVLEWDPPRHMKVRARGWPIGVAHVTLDVKPRGENCVVRITEDAVEGPGRLIPEPIRRLMLHARNTETLQRLAYLAEGGATAN
ncbi:SRPBCC family protein [Mycetocola zhujimingii]|uniref:SRPBCC family protein n=1 Tax=Mycetocola zhujimingii TaxID=2079792 RepID=A0A2U1TAY4_9MICO|nr:SRPBCC family protein [Mycetocola zhujimingii]AWB87774.1 SRPBCC family protein [Mycetocola zhujimingii]PWC06036.1 SRPBCC family protein [Mycetocola zhujimingii]